MHHSTEFMTELSPPVLKKWPFFLADLMLLIVALYIVRSLNASSQSSGWMLFLLASVALAAWIGIVPFLVQHRAEMRFAETKYLTSAVEQITNLRTFTNQISFATAQWQIVQEQASKTVETAKQIGDRMATEAQAFSEFMQKASDAEKTHLRLEVDKLRRTETEWLQVLVMLMDHTYALYLAGRRSGQENIIQQLGTFQNACRDVARKVGLVAFEAQSQESFDPKIHQLLDADAEPAANARVIDTLAPGFTFQGQLIRNVLVSIQTDGPAKPSNDPVFALKSKD
jgi:molecular chaperone GrpE (heat shock protein)